MTIPAQSQTILITGATGAVGSRLTGLLAAHGEQVRALVRDPDRARSRLDPRIEPAVGDFGDRGSLRAALDGVESVFLACGNVPEQVDYECALIDEAATAGVQRVVKLSARGAALGSPVAFWHWHAQIEQHLRAADVASVMLQPGFAMPNLLAAVDSVQHLGMLFAPAGAAPIAMVHPADVAAVAAACLRPGHEETTYVLTGPDAITYAQVAADLSAATGMSVGYVDTPPPAARAAMVKAGVPGFAADQIVAVFAALRRGEQARTTASVEIVSGRPARPFADFAREHAHLFRPAPVESALAH